MSDFQIGRIVFGRTFCAPRNLPSSPLEITQLKETNYMQHTKREKQKTYMFFFSFLDLQRLEEHKSIYL